MRGRLTSFTYDRLLRFLNVLGCNISIEVETPSESLEAKAPMRRGRVTATVSA